MRYRLNKLMLLMIAITISLAGCAQSVKRYTYPAAQQTVWPASPAQPRIKYIGSFSSAADLGINKGFFTLLAEFFVGGNEQGLVKPMAVVAPNEYEIYVADPGIKGVHYFNLKTENYKQIRLNGDYPLPSPVALTIDEQQRVLVADSALAQVYSINLVAGIAEPLPLQKKLKQPTGLAYDKQQKKLYVVDTTDHSVNIFNSHGRLLKTFGRRGNAKSEFNYPTYVWQDQQTNIWVTDSLNFRVQRFSRNGKYLGQFGQLGVGSGSFSRPKGVATDPFGHVYIVDALFHALQVFDKSGQLLLNIGQQGQNPGEFWLPTSAYIDDNSKVYVADSHNQRIQVFQYIGGGL